MTLRGSSDIVARPTCDLFRAVPPSSTCLGLISLKVLPMRISLVRICESGLDRSNIGSP